MGVTIHYEGTLDDPHVLSELLLAVHQFCFKHQWRCADVDEHILGKLDNGEPIDDLLHGVIIQPPPRSEPLWLTFDQRGELCFYHAEAKPGQYWKQEGNYTKTQFAPIETHIAVCELLRMIKDNYFPQLEVVDEGEYWETGDINLLAQHIDSTNRIIGALGKYFDEQGVSHEESKSIPRDNPRWTHDRGISANRN